MRAACPRTGLARPDLKEKIEHPRVGGPAGQGGDGVAGVGVAQHSQQQGESAPEANRPGAFRRRLGGRGPGDGTPTAFAALFT